MNKLQSNKIKLCFRLKNRTCTSSSGLGLIRSEDPNFIRQNFELKLGFWFAVAETQFKLKFRSLSL